MAPWKIFSMPAPGRQNPALAATDVLLPVLLILRLFCLVPDVVAREIPDYHGYVNDYASMMSPETRARLENVLRAFDRSDSTQVAVLTIDTLGGVPIEQFSIRVVDQWKVGQKGKDNGVLFLVVRDDRKMRIEVGRGLEHVLTDLAAGRIIDNVVAPLFKQGRFDEGFEAGIRAIIGTTRGEYTAPSGDGNGRHRGSPDFINYLFVFGTFLFFLAVNSRMLGMVGGAFFVPLFFALGLPGLIPWSVILLLLVPLGALLGLLLSLVLKPVAGHVGRTGRGGGFYTGGYSGGSFGGGFGGFGGGSFGGGGASGGW
ncbi:MAG: hypothetical protein Kow0089_07100 [Desulfobulbaceae bacterium]